MRLLLTLILVIISLTSFTQTVKFKKDVQPLIDANDYSVNAKNIALKFHQQNAKADGSLTEKAIMISWDNMYSTRIHLAISYASIGEVQSNISYLDSSIFFFKLAHDMKVSDHNKEIKTVQNLKEKMIIQNKNKEATEKKKKEEEEFQKMYGEKRITAVYTGGEFLGYCMWHFKDLSGTEYWFYNQNLGKYSEESGCRIKPLYEKDTFELMYKLSKVELYSEEGVGSSTAEKDVIYEMKLTNPKRTEQINQEQLGTCKKTIDSLVMEIKQLSGEIPSYLNTKVESPEKCDGVIQSLTNHLSTTIKSKQRAEEVASNQKKFTDSGCNSCITSVVKKFLTACVEVNGANIKANISKCCYDAKADCKHIGNNRPLKYSKLVESPDVNGAQGYLDLEKDFAVYYESENLAYVIPKGSQRRKVVVVKESGAWKVVSIDDSVPADAYNYINPTK